MSRVTPDVKRELVISGGFLNDRASTSDPKAFVYAFNGAAFPNMPLIQPRLGSVEEWTFINENNDEHPSTFTSTTSRSPATTIRRPVSRPGPDMWGVDNANVPAPTWTPMKT